ncbi:MAG TPA: chloride channel protein, partial [Arachidicoccus soli]|nr:chloride channel protein [Arachidicoccus soli]
FGMFVAIICNQYLHTQYSVLNFALIGGGAMLSAAIHAPLTSLFLTCNLVPNGFELFFPMLICCFIGKYSAKLVCSYTVYSYKGKKTKSKESPDPEMHLIG